MGRYYSGDIEGKFWFGLQASNAPSRFGGVEQEPAYITYYFEEESLEEIEQEIKAIEEKLDVDRSRGGYALDTQLITVETDDGSIAPVGGVILTVRCEYQYTRGTT